MITLIFKQPFRDVIDGGACVVKLFAFDDKFIAEVSCSPVCYVISAGDTAIIRLAREIILAVLTAVQPGMTMVTKGPVGKFAVKLGYVLSAFPNTSCVFLALFIK